MAATVVVNKYTKEGKVRKRDVSITLDSAYAALGEPLAYTDFKLNARIDRITPYDFGGGYVPSWDQANLKMKMFAPAPAIVVEEKHTAVSNAITLDYPAAFIMCVAQAGQGMQWAATGTAGGSLAANQFCLTTAIAKGVRTGITTDGATDTVYVTYITQAWADVFDNLVQEEALTLATGANNIANKMLAFGSCVASTAGYLIPVDTADTTATGEVGLLFSNATGALDINAAEDTETALFTYIKEPASGFLADRLIADEDATKTGSDPYLNTLDRQLLLWGISGYTMATGQTSKLIIEQDATPATGECNLNWRQGALAGSGIPPAGNLVFGYKDNHSLTAAAYVFGHVSEIPGLQLLEAKNGQDLSGVTIRALVEGY